MNKEDLTKGIDKLNETFKMNDDNLVLNNYERQRLFKLAYDMQIKINYLQTRIDKAIEYIEEQIEKYDLEDGYNTCMKVIDILRGDE